MRVGRLLELVGLVVILLIWEILERKASLWEKSLQSLFTFSKESHFFLTFLNYLCHVPHVNPDKMCLYHFGDSGGLHPK